MWITQRAGSPYPLVALASPVSQPPRRRHAASNSGPAARWIAPSTPPPPSSEELAALTMASTAMVVMSRRMGTIRIPAILSDPVAERVEARRPFRPTWAFAAAGEDFDALSAR